MMTTLYSMQVRMVTTILMMMMMTALYIMISNQHIRDDDQGRRPNNEDRAAHQKVSCPWEGVRPVHIFTVRSILLCIFLLICSLSTSHLRRETHSSLNFPSHYSLFITHCGTHSSSLHFSPLLFAVNISVKGFGQARCLHVPSHYSLSTFHFHFFEFSFSSFL